MNDEQTVCTDGRPIFQLALIKKSLTVSLLLFKVIKAQTEHQKLQPSVDCDFEFQNDKDRGQALWNGVKVQIHQLEGHKTDV